MNPIEVMPCSMSIHISVSLFVCVCVCVCVQVRVCAAEEFDYDLVIIGAGVGGHGAALHAVDCGLKTAIIEGGVMGGTCVNRGCIPSKALLAASGRVREMKNEMHLKQFGIQVRRLDFACSRRSDNAK